MDSRDDFSAQTKRVVAERAAHCCSIPTCGRLTVGPHSQPDKSLSTGLAGHICAASPGGPRYDPNQTPEERRSIHNAIWVCHTCSDTIDKDVVVHPKELLLRWKETHEQNVQRRCNQQFGLLGVGELSNVEGYETPADSIMRGLQHILHQAGLMTENVVQPSQGVDWNERLEVGRSLIREGQYGAARTMLLQLHREASRQASSAVRSQIANNLGVCALGANDTQQAKSYFLEALNLDSSNGKAQANMAMAALIEKDAKQAVVYSTQAWATNAHDPGILGVHLQALHFTNKTQEAEAILLDNPWALESDECAPAIAAIRCGQGHYEQAEAFARRAARKNPGDAHLYLLLGNTIVLPIQDRMQCAGEPDEVLLAATATRLEEAEQAFSHAIKLSEQQDDVHALFDALLTRSAVRLHLGRLVEGLADCEQVLRKEPTDRRALESKGRILMAMDKPIEAVVCFESLLGQSPAPAANKADESAIVPQSPFHLVSLLAQALIAAERPAQALPLLTALWNPETRETRQRQVAELLLIAFDATGDQTSAAEILHDLQQYFPGDARAWAIMAEHQVRKDNLPDAIALYVQAVEQAEPAWRHRFQGRLSHLYFMAKEYRNAALAFASMVTVQSAVYDVYAYAASLYHSGARSDTLRLTQQYRQARGVTPQITEIEVSVLEQMGNLPEASEVWRQLIATDPDNATYQIQLASVQMRAGQKQSARQTLLNVHLEQVQEDAQALLDVAELRAALRMPDVLVFAYQARQIALGDAEVHGAYMRLCLEAGPEESASAQRAFDEVCVGSAVCLSRHERTTTFVILDDGPIHADQGELNVDSPRARLLLGTRKGEHVTLNEDLLGKQEYEISEIMSKYVHAFRASMRLFSSGVLQLSGMAVLDSTEPDFVPNLLGQLDRQSEHAAKVLAAYEQQEIPLGAVASLRNRFLAEMWYSLMTWPGGRVCAFEGSEEVANSKAILLSSIKEIVLDPVAVLSIAHLQIHELVARRFQKIMVAQALVDELRAQEHHLLEQEPNAVLGSDQGQGYYFELPAGHTKPILEIVQKALYFINTFAHVMAVEALVDRDPEQTNLIGSATLASVLLAKSQSAVLYSDDTATRQAAVDNWQVDSFDTQSVLADMDHKQFLTEDEHNKLLVKLVLSNYHHVRLSAEAVLGVLEQNRFSINNDVRAVFKRFEGPACLMEAAVGVLSEVTSKVWQKNLMQHQKTFVLDMVLETLATGRNLDAIARLRSTLKRTLRLTPFYTVEVIEHINAWVQQQSLRR